MKGKLKWWWWWWASYFSILLPDALSFLVEDAALHDDNITGIRFRVLRLTIELLHACLRDQTTTTKKKERKITIRITRIYRKKKV